MGSEGQRVLLDLRDNGGVWGRHNPWLPRNVSSVVVMDDHGNPIHLTPSKGGGDQWVSRPTPYTLALLHGFRGGCLSTENSVEFVIRIVRITDIKLVPEEGQVDETWPPIDPNMN